MEGKTLHVFHDGSKIIDNGGGKLLFYIDIGKVDDRYLEQMIPRLKTEINKLRAKDEIWKGVHKIGESWAGAFDRDIDKKLQANLHSFMSQLVRDQKISEFHINPVSNGRGTVHYKLMNVPEHVQLDFAVNLASGIDRLLEPAYGVDLDRFMLPSKEKLQELAGLKKSSYDLPFKTVAYPTRSELFEAYHKYGPEMLDKYLPIAVDPKAVRKEFDDIIKHIPADQRAGYLAKGYGCKDRDHCTKSHPHYTADCVMAYGGGGGGGAGVILLKEPLKPISAKEICETQPMAPSKPTEVSKAAAKVETTISPMAALRAQRKKDGVCPECGDIKRESAVGVCRDHGKFMG